MTGLLTDRASVVSRAVGTFHFDAVTGEGHESSLRITENPIESGAAVADHAILEPKEITITGVLVGYEPPSFVSDFIGSPLAAVKDLPLSLDIKAVTAQAESMVNRYIGVAKGVIDNAPRVLAPFLPEYLKPDKDTAATLDRVGRGFEQLLALQKSGEPTDVHTGLRLYKNMMLKNISVTQMYDGSAEFSLTLREIFIVESQTAQGIHPDVKKSAPTTTQMGKTQPKNISGSGSSGEDKQSMIHKLAGWLGG